MERLSDSLSDFRVSEISVSTNQLMWRKNPSFLEDNGGYPSTVPKGILTGRATESEVASSVCLY